MNWQIDNYWNLLLLGILPLFVFLIFNFQKWKKEKQFIFAEKEFHSQLFGKRGFFSKIFPFLYLSAIAFLILSMLGFITENQEEIKVKNQQSSNILFLVDVSNSMNAQDVEPSRLEQAKYILNQTLNSLTDEKVGIILFAGEARSIMPLTTDYSSANAYLNSIHSGLIQRQGTDFLLAIQEARKRFDIQNLGAKKIILISDGEDNEGQHNNAIKEAKEGKINITTVGIGTEEGAPIPELLFNYYQDYKRDEYGQTIITKRESNALKSIAQATSGKYIDGNSLNAVENIIKDIKSSHKTSTNNTVYARNIEHYYQWFLGITLVLLIFIYLFNPKKDLNF